MRSVARPRCTSFLTAMALVWLVPIVGAVYASFRPYSETQRDGLLLLAADRSRCRTTATPGSRATCRTTTGTRRSSSIPSLLLTLFFSSMVAFVCSRFTLAVQHHAAAASSPPATCCPQQVIIQPLFQMYKRDAAARASSRTTGKPARQRSGAHHSSTSPSRPASAPSCSATT